MDPAGPSWLRLSANTDQKSGPGGSRRRHWKRVEAVPRRAHGPNPRVEMAALQSDATSRPLALPLGRPTPVRQLPESLGNRRTAQRPGPGEISAGLGPTLVDRAKPAIPIERHAGTVAMLIHTAHPIVLDHVFLGNAVDAGRELDHQMAANAAAGASRNTVRENEHLQSGDHAQPCIGRNPSRRAVWELHAAPMTQRVVPSRERALRSPSPGRKPRTHLSRTKLLGQWPA